MSLRLRQRRNATLAAALIAFTLSGSVSIASNAEEPAAQQRRSDTSVDSTQFPIRIDKIRVVGLERTNEDFVRRELGFREGDVITKEDFEFGVTRLWNTTIFAHVRGRIADEYDRGREKHLTVAIFEVQDRWTLNPLLSFGSGGGAFYFRIGATDNNLAGRFLEWYALYENFNGYDGGLAFFRDPRACGRRMELMGQLDRLIRPRPGFADQRTNATFEIAELGAKDRVRIGLRTSVFADRFLVPLDTTPRMPAPTETVFFEPRLRFGRIDTVRLRQRGVTFEVKPGFGMTASHGGDVTASEYMSLNSEVIAFAMLGDRWNFAARARSGTISRVPTHLQTYAGGLDLIRGFPDNYVRTRTMAMLNLETRFTIFDSTWVALIGAVFTDLVAARSPHGVTGGAVSAGGGIRIIVPKFVASGLRADIAVPLGTSLRGVTAEEEERFGPATPSVIVGRPSPSFGVFQFF